MEREIKRNSEGRIISYNLSNSNDTYGVIGLNALVRKFNYGINSVPKFEDVYDTKITGLEIDEISKLNNTLFILSNKNEVIGMGSSDAPPFVIKLKDTSSFNTGSFNTGSNPTIQNAGISSGTNSAGQIGSGQAAGTTGFSVGVSGPPNSTVGVGGVALGGGFIGSGPTSQGGSGQGSSSDEFSGQLYAPIGYPGQAPGDFAFDSSGQQWEWDGQQWNNF